MSQSANVGAAAAPAQDLSASPESRTTWLDQTDTGTSDIITPEQLASLDPVGTRPSLPAYTAELWRRRHFVWADARAKALGSQRGTVLGNIWLIVKPMLDASVYFVMFGLLLQTSRGIENYIGYLIIGVTMFPPMQQAVTGGAQVVRNGRNLIRGFTFPRAALPLSFTLRGAIDLLPPLAAVLILVVVLPPHALPTWRWLLAIPIFLLQQLVCLGLVLLVARATTMLPDLRNIWPFLTRFWFYGSGVFFSYERFVDHPAVLAAMDLNPGYLVLSMYRDCLLYRTVPDLRSWLLLVAWAVGTVAIGYVLFWQKEESYGVEH